MIIRAVVDTSSLVPFALRRDLQQAAQLQAFTAIWSPWIIAELNRVFVWRWIKDPPPSRVCDDLSNALEGEEMDTHHLLYSIFFNVLHCLYSKIR